MWTVPGWRRVPPPRRQTWHAVGVLRSYAKDLWLAAGWADREPPEEALYDVLFDPNEACNVAPDPNRATVLDDLRSRLDHWMESTDDPLLQSARP